jgi:hypothetical protein
MSEKKVVRRSVAIALGIICIILIAGLGGAMAYYTMIVNDKNTTYDSYASNHTQTNSEFNTLNSSYYDYMGTHSHTDSEYDALQSNYDSVIAPKLIKVHLMSDDNRPWLGTPYLHVYGYVCNVGTNIAYSSKIHVVAYQGGGVVAIDTYITLGTIYGESWTSVDTNVYYSGSALTSWTITPQWTATP